MSDGSRVSQSLMKCLCSGEQAREDAAARSSTNFSAGDTSAQACGPENIQEAESSIRDGGCLNYEEARALLGRMEYNQGNFEAALHVFEGIDIPALIPKMISTISNRSSHHKHRSRNSSPIISMSMHAVGLLFEAIFLKAKSLEHLGRFHEAALLCSTLLDIIESAVPGGLPKNFGIESKLHETLIRAIESLPELWKLAGFNQEAATAYRRALLSNWNLSPQTVAKIQKQFAIFLLHGDLNANSLDLGNNFEEAILLLMILLRNFGLKKIKWDPTILDHLIFALCICGEMKSLARQIEELLPGVMNGNERNYFLALCYYGDGEDSVALNLLKNIMSSKENPHCLKSLILASKICGENLSLSEEGMIFANKAITELSSEDQSVAGIANLLLGISLSNRSRSSASDSLGRTCQSESLVALKKADKILRNDYKVLYQLSLENARQRNLEEALYYVKRLIKIEGGSNHTSWVLLARILSANKYYFDALEVVNAAMEQTGIGDQWELLQVKARCYVEQGELKYAIETYSQLLAVIQQSRSFDCGMKLPGGQQAEGGRNIESETWYDLANIYSSISQWNDAEICLSKLKNISPLSALRWHATGKMYEAKGLYKKALMAYRTGVEVDTNHVPSLISTATMLRKLCNSQSILFARGILGDALKLDRMNHAAWFNLGLIHLCGVKSITEAAECFQAAVLLEESAPVDSFR